MNHCIICGSPECNIIFKNYPGYIKGTSFDILSCHTCESHFIKADKGVEGLYNIIYSSSNTAGYSRYYRYASTVKELEKPLEFLAFNESTYYPVYQFVKNKKKLKILEIGCGYGYLSYSLKKLGFDVNGIDIAAPAIDFAIKNFGNFYYNTNLKDFKKQAIEKYDLIISTEVIEHLEDPNDFLSDCTALLNTKGSIILTTPDKDYARKNSIWQTDLPPVHISWLGRKGIKILAQNHSLYVSFQDYSGYYSRYENRLVKYFISRKESIGKNILNENGIPINLIKSSLLHKNLSYLLHKVRIIRDISNFIYNKINGSEITLGIILQNYFDN